MDDNYEQPFHKEWENVDEEEEEELTPIPIPIPSTTHESEQFSNEQSFKNMHYKLERHLSEHLETVIEEVFQERTTLESE